MGSDWLVADDNLLEVLQELRNSFDRVYDDGELIPKEEWLGQLDNVINKLKNALNNYGTLPN